MALTARIQPMAKNQTLQGYCTNCKRPRRMIDISTEKMPNGSYLHTAKCPVCCSRIFKKIGEKDFAEVRRNVRVPMKVFMGARTPKRLAALAQLVEKGEETNGTVRLR